MEIGERRYRENNDSWPPSDGIHSISLSPAIQGATVGEQLAIQILFIGKELNLEV